MNNGTFILHSELGRYTSVKIDDEGARISVRTQAGKKDLRLSHQEVAALKEVLS